MWILCWRDALKVNTIQPDLFVSCQTVNFDLTKNYLDLVVTYTTLMTILSRIEERKAIIGLYNYAHEMTHGARWARRTHNNTFVLVFSFTYYKNTDLTWKLLIERWFCVCYSDREYPRLGQMIVDYENPLKKMMEEFVPHGKVRV